MPAALGGTRGKGRSEQQRGHLGAHSLHLAAHPGASPQAEGPAPGTLQAPVSGTLSSHPSRPSPSCALMWVTSPPLSRRALCPGASATRASWGTIPSILLQP